MRPSEAFWLAAFNQRRCAVTGATGPFDPHHVVEKQELKNRGKDIWDTRNCLRLDPDVHANHTNAAARVPLVKLREENIDYAFEVLGAFAYHYLRRRYGGDDPRLEEALRAAEGVAA